MFVLPSPPNHKLSPNPQCDAIWRGPLGGLPYNKGRRPYKEETPQSLLSLQKPGQETLIRNGPCWHLTLALPRAVRSKFLLSHPGYCIPSLSTIQLVNNRLRSQQFMMALYYCQTSVQSYRQLQSLKSQIFTFSAFHQARSF